MSTFVYREDPVLVVLRWARLSLDVTAALVHDIVRATGGLRGRRQPRLRLVLYAGGVRREVA